MSHAPAADPSPPATALLDEPVLLMSAGGRSFGVPLARVREVVTVRPCTALPGAPAWVCGLVNLRGRVVTVLDLCGRIGIADAEPAQRVVVIDFRGRAVGLAVEDAARILPAGSDLEQHPFETLDPEALLGSVFP